LTQKRWRLVCSFTIALAAFMAWYGVENDALHASLGFVLAYWGVFLLLLVTSLYLVVLDLRYIRLQYALHKRALYLETIGEESFRKSLLEAHKKMQNEEDSQKESNT
jgi:hypothetical protein